MEKDKDKVNDSEDLLVKYRDEITPTYQRAIREALLRHKKAGNSIAVSEDRKIGILQADDIEVDGFTTSGPDGFSSVSVFKTVQHDRRNRTSIDG